MTETKNRYVLAIDQGTTGSTVIIFNRKCRVASRAYSEFTQYFPKPGWVEHNPEEIWTVTLSLIKTALKKANIPADQIASIGITNQRETSVIWNRHSGRPIGNAIVWQDRRTADLCAELRQERLEPIWQDKTGLLIDPYFSATKVRWMLDNIKGAGKAAAEGDLAFGTIDSWLIWKLTGGACHVTDYSNASRTMLYNIRKLAWDKSILNRLDIPAAILPDICPSSKIIGETDPKVFFGKRVPIAGVAGDQQAALFGQTCYTPGSAKNTYGTGSFLLMNTGNTPVKSRHRLLTTIAWRLGSAPVQYAIEGSIFTTGAAIQWLRDGLGIINQASETEGLARSIASNEEVYFVPALTGLGAPYWDPHARGMIIGLTRGTKRNHIARAALESICYQTRDVVEAMEKDSGIRLRRLRVDGGAVTNRFLMQFQADILNVPVEVPRVSETTAMGAAYLAGLATGFWSGIHELTDQIAIRTRYVPKLKPNTRNILYDRWKNALVRSLAWHSA